MPPPAKTRNFVLSVYRRQRKKSWRKVARICGLQSGAHARMIALGQRPAPAPLIQQSVNAGIKNPKTLLKKIRKIAIPFFEQQLSESRVYARGGKRVYESK